MPFIYDNLVAGLISMMILLILTSIQTQATQNNTAKTSRNAVKTHAQQLATWMEEDLSKMGKNMAAGDAAFENPQDSTTSNWHTKQFLFKHDSLKAGGGTVQVKTRYQLERTGTRTVDGTDVELFEVNRSQKVGSGPWQVKGGSPSDLGYFEVSMLDEDGNPVSNPLANRDDVESIRVRFSVIAPFQTEETFLRRVRRSIVVPYRLAEK